MKRLSVLTVGIYLTAMLVSAHVMDIVKVTLPHETTVGTTTLPAGEYTIRGLTDDGSSSSTLQIRSATGGYTAAVALRIQEPLSKRAEQTQVLLRRDGDKYQLDTIWLEGQDYGYEFLPLAGHEARP